MLQHGATELKLTSLRTPISNGALAAEKLPDRIKILNWGDNPSIKGRISLTAVSAREVPPRQAALGFDRIALDFEHNTVPGTPEFERSQEPRKVAAYGVPVIVPGDGMYLDRLEWTPAGRSDALNFADLSPAVELDAQGNITFVHSVALCRNGAVEGLSFFNVHLQTKPSKLMSDKFIALSALAGILSLDASADEAAVLAKLKERLTPPSELTALSALLKDGKVVILDSVNDLAGRVKNLETASTKGIAVLSAKIDGKDVSFTAEDVVALTARVKKLEDGIAAGASAAVEAEKARLIPLFANEGRNPINPATGKAYTADELKALDVPTLKVLHANTPVTVPLHARNRAAGTEAKSNLKGLAKAMAAHKAETGN